VLDLLLLGQRAAPDFFWDARGGVLPPGATFTRASTGWTFSSTGTLVSVGINTARFYYDPATLQPLGYLTEIQSTNGVTWSQKFTDVSWTGTGVTVVDNAQISPDGTAGAATMKEDSTINARGLQWATLNIVNGSSYGLSVFAKNISGSRWLQLNLGGTLCVNFNPATGAIGSMTGAGVGEAHAQRLANGWWRFSVLITANVTVGSSLRLYMVPASNATNASSYAGDGSSTIALFGAQVDTTGVGVTGYIPTAGSTVTRAGDFLSLPVSSIPSWGVGAGGVLVVAYRQHTLTPSAGQTVVYVADPGQSNSVRITAAAGTDTRWGGDMLSGGIQQFNIFTGGWAGAFNRRKAALGWSTSRGVVAFDGDTILGTASGNFVLPVAATTMDIGYRNSSQVNGIIESIAYYAGAHPDAFVQAVSR
jgi:hypothetical protein